MKRAGIEEFPLNAIREISIVAPGRLTADWSTTWPSSHAGRVDCPATPCLRRLQRTSTQVSDYCEIAEKDAKSPQASSILQRITLPLDDPTDHRTVQAEMLGNRFHAEAAAVICSCDGLVPIPACLGVVFQRLGWWTMLRGRNVSQWRVAIQIAAFCLWTRTGTSPPLPPRPSSARLRSESRGESVQRVAVRMKPRAFGDEDLNAIIFRLLDADPKWHPQRHSMSQARKKPVLYGRLVSQSSSSPPNQDFYFSG